MTSIQSNCDFRLLYQQDHSGKPAPDRLEHRNQVAVFNSLLFLLLCNRGCRRQVLQHRHSPQKFSRGPVEACWFGTHNGYRQFQTATISRTVTIEKNLRVSEKLDTRAVATQGDPLIRCACMRGSCDWMTGNGALCGSECFNGPLREMCRGNGIRWICQHEFPDQMSMIRACSSIRSRLTNSPCPAPGQSRWTSCHASGLSRFDAQNGQVRHCRGRAG